MESIKSIFQRLRESNTSIDYARASDDELVILVQTKKDKRAEETLIKRYSGLIAHIGKDYFLKGGDKDDIQQEGLMGLVSAIKDYQPGKNKNFKQFAMLAAKRNILNAVGAANAKKHSFVSDADDYEAIERASDKGDPLKHVIDKESQKRIQDYMKKHLTTHENSVLALYLKGMTYNEIATKLGITRKSVDNAMNSVRSKMRVYKNQLKDSKLISIVETILCDTATLTSLQEAYVYLYESTSDMRNLHTKTIDIIVDYAKSDDTILYSKRNQISVNLGSTDVNNEELVERLKSLGYKQASRRMYIKNL